MRKIMIIICLLAVSIQGGFAYAHAPKEVILSFNPPRRNPRDFSPGISASEKESRPEQGGSTQETQSLRVEVMHPVFNPSNHFIYRIEITKNGEVVVDEEPSRQDATMLTEFYSLPGLKTGDLVIVTAFCNRGGEKSAQIKIAPR
ncbi:MAG: hypothetical protein JW994_05410 [Candidatus Omnitrophica bacterium]|nr:hypothetical protein [Candidatus Omnitrophota bacterium]